MSYKHQINILSPLQQLDWKRSDIMGVVSAELLISDTRDCSARGGNTAQMEVIQYPRALGQLCHFGLFLLMAEYSAAAKNGCCRAPFARNLQCLFRGACLFSCLGKPTFLGSKNHILGFSGKSRSLGGTTGGSYGVFFVCFLRYLTLFRNTGLLSIPFVSPCQQEAAMEELQCSGRTTAVSRGHTERLHVSFCGPWVGELQEEVQ